MSKKLLFIPLFLFLGLVIVLVVQLQRNAAGEQPTYLESVLIGKPLPKFKLEVLEQPGKLLDQSMLNLSGQPFLLNVWATWCPTCYAEHRYLNILAQQGIPIVGLNYKDDRDKAIQWLSELKNPYVLNLYDGAGMVGMDLGVYGAPETFLIDGEGIIRYRYAGNLTEAVWQQKLQPLYNSYKGK